MENKKYSWVYHYSMFKHYDWLKTMCWITAITVILIVIPLALSRPDDIIGVLVENLWVIGLIVGIYGISIMIALIWYRKGYTYRYTIENDHLRVSRPYVPMSHEMNVNEKIGSDFYFKNIRYIKLNKDTESISIRGKFILTTVYADKGEIDYIYQLIKQSCVNLKGEKR